MIKLIDILTPERTINNVNANSKKRALELASKAATSGMGGINAVHVFNSLISRERLGSTGIGSGIAIPHCRIKGLDKAVGVLIRLKQAINFDAIDNQPVDIILTLLVPEDSDEEHLQLLAMLAEHFSNEALREKIRSAESNMSLYEIAVHYDD